MGNILKAIKKRFSRRQHSTDDNCGLDVVEDSPYYPFSWRPADGSDDFGVVLYTADEYKKEIFADFGFEGNGYDWEAVAQAFIRREQPDVDGKVSFDPEADTFLAYSKDEEALRIFVTKFKEFCEDDERLAKVLSCVKDENLL